MGLTSHLNDVGGDSIPILLVVAAATCVSYVRSLLLCLLHPFTGLHRPRTTAEANEDHLGLASVGSGLAGLILLAEQLNSHRSFSYGGEEEGRGCGDVDCVVCLSRLRAGESVRKLSCCHVFHSECLDGWFDQKKLSCPLCRSPLVSEERRSDAERRIGADVVAWLAPY